MHFALDHNLSRITPTIKGQRAYCPLCNGVVIGKCGEIYKWHWQHQKDRDCDPWKEHETAWHRKWKANFPLSWQEYVIDKHGEKHRADIRTDKGVVIEFQNSSISTTEVRVREQFYGDMIWVVNAIEFKDNFSIRSEVRSKLRSLEYFYSERQSSLKDLYSKDLKELDKGRAELDNLIFKERSSLNFKRSRSKELEEGHRSFVLHLEEKLKIWGEHSFGKLKFWQLDKELKIPKERLQSIKQKLNELENQKGNMKNTLKYIIDLKSIIIEEREFKFVSWDQLPKNNYAIIRVILKNTLNDLFPTIKEISNSYELEAYKYKLNEYCFVVDPSFRLEEIANLLTRIEIEQTKLASDVPAIHKEMLLLAHEWFSKELLLIKDEIEVLEQKIKELEKQKEINEQRKLQIQHEMTADIKATELQDDQDKRNREFEIKRAEKGYYSYHWLHERTTWREAQMRLFFDFGKGYLFERICDSKFKKVEAKEFIKQFYQ